MKIAIGTDNDLKVEAISGVLREVYRDAEIVKVSVRSGVGSDPVGDDKGVEGALTRARNAMKKADADLGVGHEGITNTTMGGTTVYGWVVIMDKEGRFGKGASAQVDVPDAVAELMWKKHLGLAEAISEKYGIPKEDVRFKYGTNGFLTKGRYTRTDEIVDATSIALARFLSPELYDS
ncbi:MAG: inosine/xanthosine triphosphatase [Candidatus Marsarchaeota archaeon]|nr:inosine/xanthosine triphosphatase [Candidatus Marsarchaeota archaeon]